MLQNELTAPLLADLDDQLESLRDNVSYVQENINECQSNIVQLEESKVVFINCSLKMCVVNEWPRMNWPVIAHEAKVSGC